MSLMTIEPFSGFSRPTSDLRNTDLPVPEGPSSTEISPGGRVRVTSLQMFWLPNDFDRFSTSTATPTSYLPLHSGCVAGSPPRRIDEPRQCAGSQGRPHPDDGEPLLLVGNDDAEHRLRVSQGFRDADPRYSPTGATETSRKTTRAALREESGPCLGGAFPGQTGEGVT